MGKSESPVNDSTKVNPALPPVFGQLSPETLLLKKVSPAFAWPAAPGPATSLPRSSPGLSFLSICFIFFLIILTLKMWSKVPYSLAWWGWHANACIHFCVGEIWFCFFHLFCATPIVTSLLLLAVFWLCSFLPHCVLSLPLNFPSKLNVWAVFGSLW